VPLLDGETDLTAFVFIAGVVGKVMGGDDDITWRLYGTSLAVTIFVAVVVEFMPQTAQPLFSKSTLA
jgi:hypothetical protein